MSCYGKLRAEARSLTAAEIHRICTPLDHRTPTSSICSSQARDVSKILLLYDFRLGGMIRCLGGEHISDLLDFTSIDACILALSDIPVNQGEPPHDFPEMQHLFHQHTPFKASFGSAIRDLLFSNSYNNHLDSDPYFSSIHKKSATNIQKSYPTALPRRTLDFVSGLLLVDLGYATCEHKGKVKGRKVNDPSDILSVPNDSGALNSHIDR